jgi:hypothetical protein
MMIFKIKIRILFPDALLCPAVVGTRKVIKQKTPRLAEGSFGYFFFLAAFFFGAAFFLAAFLGAAFFLVAFFAMVIVF